jgi:DedD protein
MKEDLLMDNGNKNNLKKPLIYGAVVFLIFIIGVIAVALFQNSKNENQIVPVDNKPQEVAPKPQVQTQTQTDFQPLQVEEEKPKINKEKLIENTEKNQTKSVKPKETAAPIAKTPKTKPENVKKEAVASKPVVKSVSKPKSTKTVTQGKYYIQVAALLKHAKPNKKFLQIIKENGFNYTFYVTYINKNGEKIKVTKILVGPFKDKKEAKKALVKVKQKITQNAFIFKVK